MKARPDFQERRDSAARTDRARRRRSDAREEFEERRLPRAIPPDDAHYIALFHFEVDVLQRPDILARPFARPVIRLANF